MKMLNASSSTTTKFVSSIDLTPYVRCRENPQTRICIGPLGIESEFVTDPPRVAQGVEAADVIVAMINTEPFHELLFGCF